MKHVRFIIFIIAVAAAVIGIVKTQFPNDTASEFSSKTQNAHTPIDFEKLPEKGMVTLIDLGATECIPCKMMAPIMEKLEADYQGKAVIAFIDVWKHKDQAPKYGIRAIPTQIFFDESGKEIFRHQGFLSEDGIVNQLEKMGVTPKITEKG